MVPTFAGLQTILIIPALLLTTYPPFTFLRPRLPICTPGSKSGKNTGFFLACLQNSEQKAKRVEMRGIYNALFGLRQKIEQLGLTVRSRRDGYYGLDPEKCGSET
jgi:hypothetical protein